MVGIGTLINTIAIILGGILGYVFKNFFKEEQQDSLSKACGISVFFIAIAGAMEGMLRIEGNFLVSGKAMLVVICITLGTMIGEAFGIEKGFEQFGEWLKKISGNSKDKKFVDGFVMASFTVCIGAMAIVGSIQDGITGDYSILAVKSVLDLIIVAVMTASMGKGCVFSAIPVFILEGSITLLARGIAPFMTDLSLEYISLVGSILILCVGVNLVWGKKVRVANMLPAVFLAMIAAYMPFNF